MQSKTELSTFKLKQVCSGIALFFSLTFRTIPLKLSSMILTEEIVEEYLRVYNKIIRLNFKSL